MASVLRGTIDFLKDFGLFDVILPFLLIFAIVFAILEKTMILGKDKDNPKQNLNSIVALVIALLFISANKAVNLLTNALPNIALIMVAFISFLLMLGVFWKSGEFNFKDEHKNWYILFTFVVLVALILVILGSYEHSSGVSLLSYWFSSVGDLNLEIVYGVVALLVLILAIWFVARKPKRSDT